ncbi:accessory Sec system S-layer assembly protein [Anaerobacillus isosaccharinicus]|uniref:Accessory Sec system S-layer assembly protein n=1 Tax=Anaerobacillus isosaccharinicus TaxID=1532552 RepID=A0A1S2LUX2_9BACI|nr:accessory Sec system S-layer assembly protein [Anaerobacillus isosaccharinicus]MBA5584521.1 accessory Sec system S-layer assembly protein [Anaerobacillus isosaccharinicus]QOY37095.1 accessory Sec system S-layer assembly protein [Anaerobacillus isosaccharinicus]
MKHFFKKKDDTPQLQGEESAVSSNDLINETGAEVDETEVTTQLSLHPSWNLQKQDLYVYQFLNEECPPLLPNQLSLYGISLIKEDGFRVSAFIRNSLDKAIKLEETTLVLLDSQGQVLGRKAFNLSEVGEIPAKSSRPWHFLFTSKDLFSQDEPAEGWKLAFQLKPSSRKHELELADSWKNSLAEDDKKKLEEMVNNLTPPKEGEVNFLGLQAKRAETGDLHVTMLIRNGSEKDINLEQLPLIIEDANGDVVAKGGFKLEEFKVKANTSKPWTFIFPSTLVLKEDMDLSRWKAYPPKTN